MARNNNDDMLMEDELAAAFLDDSAVAESDDLDLAAPEEEPVAEEPSEDDLLNYGYSLWFSGSIDDAADCFHRYLKESGHDKEFIIENEAHLIQAKGISEPEIQMMLYIL